MKAQELRKKKKIDLQKLIGELQEQLRQLRFDLSAGKVKNVKEIRNKKKEVAKIHTILREQRQQ